MARKKKRGNKVSPDRRVWVVRDHEDSFDPFVEYLSHEDEFSIKLHHGGTFAEHDRSMYEGGQVDFIDQCDSKTFSLLVMNNIMLALGYSVHDIIFYSYVDPRGNIYSGPRLYLQTDEETIEFLKDAVRFKVIDVYCEIKDLPGMIVAIKEVKDVVWTRAIQRLKRPCSVQIMQLDEEGRDNEPTGKRDDNNSGGGPSSMLALEYPCLRIEGDDVGTFQQLNGENFDPQSRNNTLGGGETGYSMDEEAPYIPVGMTEQHNQNQDDHLPMSGSDYNGHGFDEIFSQIMNEGDSQWNMDDMEQTTQLHQDEGHQNVNQDFRQEEVDVQGREGLIDDDSEDEVIGDELDGDDEGNDIHDKGSAFMEDIEMQDNGSGTASRSNANVDDADLYGFGQDNVNAELHSDDDGQVHRRYTDFRSPPLDKVPIFEVKMKFANKKEFRDAVTTYRALTGRQVFITHNDPHRLRAKCRGQDCKYHLYAKTVAALNSPDYVLVTMNPGHSETCMPQFEKNKIPAEWVAERFLGRFKANTNTPVRQIRVYVDEQFKTEISKAKAYRARSLAKYKIEGSISEQYGCLWDYAEELKRTNPNTTVSIKFAPRENPGRNPRFMRWYCCLGALKEGFKDVCRPVIFVDGCFTKGIYKGQVLVALGVDPSNGFWPIAWAVVEKECKATWLWFFKKLKKDLDISEGNSSQYTIMSDQQKGLGAAVTDLFPYGEKRYCVQHMYKNFKGRHPGKEMKSKFWTIANSTTEESYNWKMEALETEHPAVAKTVRTAAPKEQWVKAFFPSNPKCDTLVNNTCESFNAKIVEGREKPIVGMLETFRVYSMDRIRRRGEWGRKNNNLLTPAARNVLAKNYEASTRWKSITNGAGGYEVKGWGNQQYIVYPDQKTCTCRAWQLSGIPCCHAIVCILKLGENPATYVHECYLQSTFNRLYSHVLQPINGIDMWPKSGKPSLEPPHNVKQIGRPSLVKRVEAVESIAPDGTIRMKRHIVGHCTNCGGTGHNIRTCKLPSMADQRFGFGVPQAPQNEEASHVQEEQFAQEMNNEPVAESETTNQPPPQPPILRRGKRQRVANSNNETASSSLPSSGVETSNGARGVRGRGGRGSRGSSRGGRMPKTYSDKIRENENAEYLGLPIPHKIGRWARQNLERVP